MVKKCCVPNCREEVKVHRLPKDTELRQKWLQWLKLIGGSSDSHDPRICHAHFAAEFKVPGTRRGLRVDAVPTLLTDTAKVALSVSASTTSASVNHNSSTVEETSEVISEIENASSTSWPSSIGCEDFNKICRICLKQSPNLQPIFVKSLAWRYIESCAAIKVSLNDGLPRNICDGCTRTSEQICAFINQVKCSNQYLWNLMEKSLEADQNFESENRTECNKSFTTQKQSNGHVKTCSDQYLCNIIENTLEAGNNLESEGGICRECNKSFATKKQFNRHLKIHSLDQQGCEMCGKIYRDRSSLLKHLLMKHSENRIKPHKCSYCAKSFDVSATLTRHLRTHSGERPFGCDVCHKSYPSKSYLHKHKMTHEPIRDRHFICEVCSKSFIFKEALSAHLATHSDRRPFRCALCDKSCTTNGSLQSHIKYIHTKEKNYMCQMCGKFFTTSSGLNYHLRRHTSKITAANHACSLCFKKLSTATHLKLHMRAAHTGERPYCCDFCPRKFVSAPSLRVHRRYHTGDKPFACSFCAKTFVTNGNRRVHERVHTGEKPYKCSFCDSCFTQSGTLKIHMKGH